METGDISDIERGHDGKDSPLVRSRDLEDLNSNPWSTTNFQRDPGKVLSLTGYVTLQLEACVPARVDRLMLTLLKLIAVWTQ